MDLDQASRLAEMALDMTEQPDLPRTLDRILGNAGLSIPCDAVGVLLQHSGGADTAAATDDVVRQVDLLTTQLDGPGSAVLDPPAPFERCDGTLIADTRAEERWPVWGAAVADLGLRSVLSVRLCSPVRALGHLGFYARTPGAFTEDDGRLAVIFARHASIALAGAQFGDSLRQAVVSRHLIGQAQGILMARYGIVADEAFSVLRRYSQNKNVKLRVIAERVIAITDLPD